MKHMTWEIPLALNHVLILIRGSVVMNKVEHASVELMLFVLVLRTHVILLMLGKLFCNIIRNCTYDLILIHFTVELVSVEVLMLVTTVLLILSTDVSTGKLSFQSSLTSSQLLSYDICFMNLQHLKNATN